MPLTKIKSLGITDGTIALADLSATGTKDSTTFLRGDNTFATAGAAAGQVIQVLSATDSTQRRTTSTSFVTNSNTLSVTITPSSSSNKILIIATTSISVQDTGWFTIYRGATDLGAGSNKGMLAIGGGINGTMAMNYLDSPATTSATTYQVYYRCNNVSTPVTLNNDNSKGSITCLEIKG